MAKRNDGFDFKVTARVPKDLKDKLDKVLEGELSDFSTWLRQAMAAKVAEATDGRRPRARRAA